MEDIEDLIAKFNAAVKSGDKAAIKRAKSAYFHESVKQEIEEKSERIRRGARGSL